MSSRIQVPARLAILLQVLCASILPACGGGGGGGSSGPQLVFTFGSPSALTVDTTAMTFVVEGQGLAGVALLEPAFVLGQEHAGRFYVWGVALHPGTSTLRFQATRSDGSTFTDTLTVHNSELPAPAVRPSFDPQQGSPGEEVRAQVEIRPGVDAAEVLLDVDADGAIDQAGAPGQPLVFPMPMPGHTLPRVTVRTHQGLYFSSDSAATPRLSSLPAGLPAAGWSAPADLAYVIDLEHDPKADRLWVLGGPAARLHAFDVAGAEAISRAIPEVAEPGGFCLAENGDVYVSDRAQGRVVRLLAATGLGFDANFAGDGFLGEPGSGPGQLDQASGVALLVDAATDTSVLCVADRGNDRLQVFALDGSWLREIRGPAADLLAAPAGLVSVVGSAVAVTCPTQGRVRVFSSAGAELSNGSAGLADLGTLVARTFEIEHPHLRLVVHDAARGEVLISESNGEVVRRVTVAGSPSDAVVFERSGEMLLALGRGAAPALEVIAFAQDPHGAEPAKVTEAFFAALAAGDLPALEELCSPSVYAALVTLADDPAGWAEAQELAAGLQGCAGGFQDERHAGVTCDFVSGAATSSTHQQLVRHPLSGKWLIHAP